MKMWIQSLTAVVDLGEIGTWLAILAGIIISTATIFGFMWKFFIKPKVIEEIKTTTKCEAMTNLINLKADKAEIAEINEKLENAARTIENISKLNQAMIRNLERSVEADKHILQGVFACLDGLHQLNCNGKVTTSIDDMRDFLIKREDTNIQI
jgi:hypothetical protein